MVGEREKRLLRHRVDRVRGGEPDDVEQVGHLRVLRSRARPEEALRAGAPVQQPEPAVRGEKIAVGPVRPLRHRDPKTPPQRGRHAVAHRRVPAADEERRDGGDVGVQPRRHASLDPPDVRLRRGEVLLAREEERHVHRDAGEDRLLDRRHALAGPGDLDEQIRPLRPRMELLGRRHRPRRVVSERRRELERHPAVDAVRQLVDRAEEIGRLGQILERQVEEERLPRPARAQLLADGRVVLRAAADRVVKDGRVRGETGDRELLDVPAETSTPEETACDVVEPDALAGVVQPSCAVHVPSGAPSGECQPPTSAASGAASAGPQLPGSYM